MQELMVARAARDAQLVVFNLRLALLIDLESH